MVHRDDDDHGDDDHGDDHADDHDDACDDDQCERLHLKEALPALPIFPLSGTVFFPNTLLPLHIFEPRYRQMTEQVLATHRFMAIVCSEPSQQQAPKGCARVAGLGRLVHHERLPDGRFHILLQGMGRVRLDDELPMDGGRLYRRCSASLMDQQIHDVDDDEHAAIADELSTLRGCYARLSDTNPDCKDVLGDLPLRLAEPHVVADLVAAALLEDVVARQRTLEEPRLLRRLQIANDALATLLLHGLPAEAGTLH